ncbi:MAG TPA: NAD(P)-dependent oxidoreductase, partial [Steroidobacteraceae bacterium]|nr:NAD(P)-dependent oxidoreductase [Steroidobacteraceae bacterium]
MTGSAFTARLVLARRLVTGVPTVLGAYALLFSTVSLQAAEPPAESAAATYLIDTLGVPVAPVAVRERTGWHEPRIILTDAKLSALLPQLRGIAPKARFVEMPEANARDIADADVALGVCTQEMLEQAKRIQWIQTLGAGVDRCVELPILHKRQPLVTNMQRVAAPSMAEHVIALMLALSRRLPYFMKEQEQGRWIAYKDAPLLADLDGKTVLIAGLGGIGTEVAKRAHALGMRVTATRARGRSGPEYVYYVGLPDELLKLTKDADFVVNCTPLTPKTKGIFDQEFFAAMKPTAYFISVGRGPSTVTADL